MLRILFRVCYRCYQNPPSPPPKSLVLLQRIDTRSHDLLATVLSKTSAIAMISINSVKLPLMKSCWQLLCCMGWTVVHMLTYSMVQSPSWEANWFAASQQIPRISWNPKVHYRTHKRPPPVSILGQPNPVHITISHLLEIQPNIINPSTSRSPQWSSWLQFPQQEPINLPLLTHTRHMPSPSHSSPFYHPHNIGWAVQII